MGEETSLPRRMKFESILMFFIAHETSVNSAVKDPVQTDRREPRPLYGRRIKSATTSSKA